MVRRKNETEDLLISVTKNYETFIKQTHRKAEETIEFKLTKTRKIFHFKPPLQIEGSWMIGLTGLEVYNSIFNITEKINNFELYTDNYNEFSFMELRDELEQIFNIEDITTEHLQDDKIGPLTIKFCKKIKSEKSNTDAYLILLTNYAKSPFREVESYLRIVIDLEEDDIKLVFNQFNSNFVTHEIPPGVHTFKDTSEAVYALGDPKGTLRLEYDDVSIKTKLILSHL